MRGFLTASLCAAGITFGHVARAEDRPCGTEGHPWVRLVVAAAVFDDASSQELLTQIKVALAARFIDVCSASETPSSPALATLEIATREGDRVAMTVLVRDAVTDKRVAREIDLTDTPPDGRPLTVALAADELLRASWAEINLIDAPPSARPIPVEVRESVRIDGDRDRAPDRPRHLLSLGVAGAAEPFDVVAHFEVTVVRLSGVPKPGARPYEASGTALYLGAGPRLIVEIAQPLNVFLGCSFGLPLRTLAIIDDSTRVGGLSGVVVGSSLGIGATL